MSIRNFPGRYHNRIHLTEKPLQHDTAILVVVLEGYNATGIAVMDKYAKAGQEWIAQELEQTA